MAKPRKNSKRNSKPDGGSGKKRKAADWAPAFLAALIDGLHIRDAAAAAGVDGTTPYKRRKHDAEFRAAWEEAAEIGTKALEREAARRAYHGTLKPVYQGGVKVGEIREYSDALLMFLLRARKPKKYRENYKVQVGDTPGQPMKIVGIDVYTTPPPEIPDPWKAP